MLYAFGSNGCGQLGLDHADDLSSPALVPLADRRAIQQIAAGGNHTILLLEDGDVYSFGNDEAGRSEDLTHALIRTKKPSDSSAPSDPTARSVSTQIVQVSATWSASLYLCSDGTIFVAGQGTSGELGLDVGITSSQPTPLARFLHRGAEIAQIVSCMGHSIVVASNGEVWGWGKGRKGQLGEPARDVWKPRRIDGIKFHVVEAVCGKDFTCVIGSRSTGEVAVYGPDRNDRFGVREQAPTSVPGWKSIAASWGSVYILKDDGSIVAWGRNDHGQLPPIDLPPINAIAAGSEHCVALTKAGKLLAWGWGEHGNCGLPTDKSGDVKNGWNEIAVNGDALKLFAGCATSFVATSIG